MTFKKTFCSSPWFHMSITNTGTYEPCRWVTKNSSDRVNFDRNIRSLSPRKYFQNHMQSLRTDLLQGQRPAECNDCHVMERHGKPSGRQRQLLKVGVLPDHFDKSLASSTLRKDFDYTWENQGHTTRVATDWQINLGNYCNGACIFCHPQSSSTLAAEFKKIGLIDNTPVPAWSEDPELLDKFIKALVETDNLQYLHFLGGETVITPGFKKILQTLVDAKLSQQVSIGFTTNLTVWSQPVVDLLTQFQEVHLGMSVETMSQVNDYVRYPSKIDQVKSIMQQWKQVADQHGWLIQLRVTPTCLTIQDLHTVYDYAWVNHMAVESCNFLDRPEFLRISVLPKEQRTLAHQNLTNWIESHKIDYDSQIINTRDPNISKTQIVQDAKSYVHYLEIAEEESHRLPQLVDYIKKLESNRKNCILDYVPEYENLFRSAGY